MGVYDFEQFNIYNGIQKTLSSDYVKIPLQFLDKNKWKYYVFELDDYVNFRGKRAYVIKFQPKGKNIRKSLVAGRLYIDIESSAMISYEFEVPEHLHDKFKKVSWIKFIGTIPKKYREIYGGKTAMKRTMTDYNHRVKVDFQEYEGKWYLSSIRNTGNYHNHGSLLEDIWFETTRELIVNEIITEHVPEIPRKERFSGQLFNYPISYAPEFWERYNTVLPSGIFAAALGDLEKGKSLEEQFRGRVTKDTTLLPPVAKKVPVQKTIHEVTLTDEYQWLQQPYEEEVQQYIRAENAYTKNYMIPLEKRRRKLFLEMVERVKKNDESVPVKIDDYYYYARFADTLNYPIYCRKYQTMKSDEVVIMDVNLLAEGYDYFNLSIDDPSPDHRILPYYENLNGGFESTLRFKDLQTGLLLSDSLTDVSGLVWYESGDAFLYTRQHPKTKRDYQVYLHRLGSLQSTDELIYQEQDPTFSVGLGKSKSRKFLFLYAGSKDENEVYLLDASTINKEKQLFYARQEGHRYGLTHVGNTFYISSNLNAPNFQLYQTREDRWNFKDWLLLVPHQEEALLTDFQVFDSHIVWSETRDAQQYLKVMELETGKVKKLRFGQRPHVVGLRSNPDPSVKAFRFEYEDPMTPPIVYEYVFETGQRNIVKQYQVQGPYDDKEYRVERIMAAGHDGAEIPITLIYKKGAMKPSVTKINGKKTLGKRKLYLTSYGAYGVSSEPYFSYARLSLLDQQVIYAIAHVRGGSDKGEAWYQDGKFMKKNTFRDFISVAEHLIAEDYIEKGRIIASGGSAGGLLVGAVVNERPDLFQAAILNMPFLDVVNTMLDESLPLTTEEYKEWGDPRDKAYFDYMYSYAPYENVKHQDYPSMLFTCAINDDNVPYWETVKMVARLRAHKTDGNEILLKVNTSGGHGGGSRRFDGFQDLSVEYAYMLDLWK